MALGTCGFVRNRVQVQCHPEQGSEASYIAVMHRVYGVGNLHGDTLSYKYGTICLKQCGPSLDGLPPEEGAKAIGAANHSAERRETQPRIKRHDACTWGQDLDWIEVELLQFGDALRQ